jgi:hypothetical protein
MKRNQMMASAAAVVGFCALATAGEVRNLSKEVFVDKCKGAWAGQMIGVCYGANYEFKSNGTPYTGPIEPWKGERVAGAITQDDVYVEMTWLKALEQYGLDVTNEQAGKAFAETKFPLWHANLFGRRNVQRGIMPPMSGNPKNNLHADDIDFQIESDLLGIICPGLPREANRLCDTFGHVMNYGDGVYGGMFVGGMYVAGYFEDCDVEKVVRAGLACIPEKSTYHQCISDVLTWHRESPKDWLATWKKIEAKWQDDVDCMPSNPLNIDAKLNGAYIVMGLLYGDGDMIKTMEIPVRCGQDSDCNPSSAAGVLACMKGYKALGEPLTGGIAAIADTKFSHTDYSWNTLIPACQKMAEKIIVRAGGKVEADGYVIPVQKPVPAKLEQWTDKKDAIKAAVSAADMRHWAPGWGLVACGPDMEPGLRDEEYGRKNVLVIHPVSKDKPAVIAMPVAIPDTEHPQFKIDVASYKNGDVEGDYVLRISVNKKKAFEETIATKGQWKTITLDLTPYRGKTVPIKIENHANGWSYEGAFLCRPEIK